MKKIIYDFDGTLTPFSIPRFSILEKCGYEDGALNPKFLNEVKTMMKNENLDLYVSFYKTMFDKMNENNIELKDSNFCYGAEDIEYNKGVIYFLENLHKNNIYNYVLSSGLKVYLEKTKISPFIKDIFGTTFKYNENDEVIDFDILMNDKKKVIGIKKILESLGWTWVATMEIGKGCQVHLRANEIPMNETIIVSVSKHLTCIKNGIINDTYDCSRDGNRCVYGYFIKKKNGGVR